MTLQKARARILAFLVVCVLLNGPSAIAQVRYILNFESGQTIPMGVQFGVNGSAISDGPILTNITASIGGIKISEMTANEQIVMFNFLLSNSIPGKVPMVIDAFDALGRKFTSGPVTIYFPGHATVRITSPTNDDVTVILGQELTVRAEAEIDFGSLGGVYFWLGQFEAGNTNTFAPPHEMKWRPQRLGKFDLNVGPFVSYYGGGDGFSGDWMTITVVPPGIPVITQISQYGVIGPQEDVEGRRIAVTSHSRDPQKFQWLLNGEPIPGATNNVIDIEKQRNNAGLYSLQIENFAGRTISEVNSVVFDVPNGGLVRFSNHAEGIDAPISSPGQFTNHPPYITATLFAGPEPHRMRPVVTGIVVTNGYFDAGIVSLPNIAPGQKAFVQVAALDSIPMALKSPLSGRSKVLEITAGTTEPAILVGLEALALGKDDYFFPQWVKPIPTFIQAGQSAEFKISVWTSELQTNLVYQWRKNSKPIPGATNDTFRIENAQRADAAYYSVVASDRQVNWREIGAPLGVQDSMTLTLAPNGLQLSGEAGRRYTLESSPNLTTWSSIKTLLAESENISISVPPPQTNVFYRAILEP